MVACSQSVQKKFVPKRRLAVAVSAAVMASTLPGGAMGQVLEEVIVTATKRAESVMDVPLACLLYTSDAADDAMNV